MTVCSSTERVKAGPGVNAAEGVVRWRPGKSLWVTAMTLVGVVGAPFTFSAEALTLFLVTTAVTICAGHSVGMHRLLIHRSFKTPKALEYLLVWLGVLVGMAGPFGMIRAHDLRDWAQRQRACHDHSSHGRPFLIDAFWQMHCDLDLRHPPRLEIEAEVRDDPVYRFFERTWMLQNPALAVVFFAVGGLAWVVWGVCLRVAVSLTGHWLVGHFAHRRPSGKWYVAGACVQGFNVPFAALVTFGESWHNNHHAFPGSARLGLEKGQADPGWWMILVLRALGLAWDIRTPTTLPARADLHRLPQDHAAADRARKGFSGTLGSSHAELS